MTICLRFGGGQAGGGELFGEQAGEVGGGLRLHPCGDFLGAQFEQEVGHDDPPIVTLNLFRVHFSSRDTFAWGTMDAETSSA